jgi:type II secretory pathway pseudopilin PulG
MKVAAGSSPDPKPQTPDPRRVARRRSGFTLIEAALATVIIGTGVLAILAAQQAYHRKNNWAQRTGTAMLLANEIRELTLTLPQHDPITGTANMGPEAGETVASYDDLDDFAGPVTNGVGAGVTFDPPINALRQTVADLDGWSQVVRVENVLPDNISSTFTQNLGTTDLMRVTVTINYQSPQSDEPMTVTTLTWMVGE